MFYNKEIRKKAGLTQREMADLAGLSQNHVALVESGKRNLSPSTNLLMCKICQSIIDKNIRELSGVKNANSGDAFNVIGNERSNVQIEVPEREESALEARVKSLEADVSQLKSTIINILTRMGE